MWIKLHWRIQEERRGPGMRPSSRVNLFHFHATTEEKFSQIIGWRPHLGDRKHCLGNPGFTIEMFFVETGMKFLHNGHFCYM